MEPLSFVFGDRATVPGFLGLDVQKELIGHVLGMSPDKVLLVTDRTVDMLHGDYFSPLQLGAPILRNESGDVGGSATPPYAREGLAVEKFLLPEGDACKTWEHLTQLVQWAFAVAATKRSLILAAGGGALLNVAGLFASMLYRGTKLVSVPTTFLAMHDVVTSLKTSICFDGRKNNIGSFYAPTKILIDVAFCRTLPRGELFSGIGELAKNAALFGGKHAEGFTAALSKQRIDSEHGGSGEEFVVDDRTLMQLVRLGVDAKMAVLRHDAYEKTSGMIFEYGHTVSHAIEKAYGDGTVPHGLGVAYGMLSSSYAAQRLGIMAPADRHQHDDLCWKLVQRWPLPEPKPSAATVLALAMRDSKRGITCEATDELSDVLLRKMGDVVPTETNMLSKFPCQLVLEWLLDMGFPPACPAPTVDVDGPAAAEPDCEALLHQVGGMSSEDMRRAGYEPLTVGFANTVCAVKRGGRTLVAKRYTDLVFLRLAAEAVGAVDVYAGEQGLGPRVLYSSIRGLVMERLPGRTLEEADMHRGDLGLLTAVAGHLAALHRLPPPSVAAGEPMLWRTVDKMMDVVRREPRLLPPGFPSIAEIAAEIEATRKVLQDRQPRVVLGHGDFKPSNILLHEGAVTFIDFELGGPNYRGFDLMKVFRTAANASEQCMALFLRAYAEASGPTASDAVVSELLAETRLFEPLTWLEAAVFFLALPQFKPSERSRWHALAVDRWLKFEQTRENIL